MAGAPPVFITAATISAELYAAMREAEGLALTAKNARALAVRAGTQAIGFRAITDFIEELATGIIQQSRYINQLAQAVAADAVAEWRADLAQHHFVQVQAAAPRYINSLAPNVERCAVSRTNLTERLESGLGALTAQLDDGRRHIRTANLISTSSHVEAANAGEFRQQLEVIADNIKATAARIGQHLKSAESLLNQHHYRSASPC